MPYPQFDTLRLNLDNERQPRAAAAVEDQLPLAAAPAGALPGVIHTLGAELVQARNQGGASLFLCSPQVVLAGVARQLGDLFERGLVTHLALDPVGAWYDWQLATTGRIASAAYFDSEQFHPAEATGSFFEVLADGVAQGFGCGEAWGEWLHRTDVAHPQHSLLAQAYRWGVSVTVHTVIGGDALQVAPAFDPQVLALGCRRDFLVLGNSVENLEQGIVYQWGRINAAVQAFFTSLAMSRNVAAGYGRDIRDFTAAVFTKDARDEPLSFADDRGRLLGTNITTAASSDRHSIVHGVPHRDSLPALRLAALAAAGWQSPVE